MPLWGNVDNAANSDIAVLSQVNKGISTAERTALYGNTMADAYFAGKTVGQFGVDNQEMASMEGTPKPAHAGWSLRTVGSGGRAGRVFYETLVAMGSMTGDGSDDAVVPDYTIRITTQPVNATGNTTNNQVVTFTAAATTRPVGGTVMYQWLYSTDGGSTWASANGVAGFEADTTASLKVWANTALSGTNVRSMISVTGAATQNTSAAKFTRVT